MVERNLTMKHMLIFALVCASLFGNHAIILTANGDVLAISVYIKDKGQIAMIDPKDVSSLVILTGLDSNNGGAIPSPDGKQIAFVSDRDGNNEVYIMSANGKNPHRVTNNLDWDCNTSWSPDGRKLVLNRWDGNKSAVYIIDADGQNETLLADEADGADWSPDGRRIVLVAKRLGFWGVYVIDMDNGRWDLITWPGSSPRWSPDGKRIAFVHSSQIWVVDLENRDRVQLTDAAMPGAGSPCWSPDGKGIAYAVQNPGQDPHWETWIMNADGKNRHKLDLRYSSIPSSWFSGSIEQFIDQRTVHPSGKLTMTWGKIKRDD